MLPMNWQLSLFFKQVGITHYPKKSITLIITAFFLVSMYADITTLLEFYFDLNIMHYYVSGWLYNIIYPAVYLAVTVSFYLLADFDFEPRNI